MTKELVVKIYADDEEAENAMLDYLRVVLYMLNFSMKDKNVRVEVEERSPDEV